LKVLHCIGGGDAGGARTHVLSLLRELNSTEEVRLLCLGSGPLSRRAEELGLPCAVAQGGFARQVRAAGALLRAEDWQALHCHGSRANVLGALLKDRAGCPVLSTVHSDHTLDYLGRRAAGLVYGGLNAWALRRMDALVCVSEAMAELYRGRGFGRVYAIYNGVDFAAPRLTVAREARAAALGVPVRPEDVLLGTAARFDSVKDLPTLLRGFARTEDPRLKLLLAGAGPEEGRLRALANELNLAGRVFFLGWLEDVEPLYAALDAAVLTSRSETFPYALTMAARYAIPAVSTAVGGVGALIEDGVNGCLFPVGDEKALAEALDRLAASPAERAKMGAALRQKAEERFSLAAMAERQREIYRSVTGGKR